MERRRRIKVKGKVEEKKERTKSEPRHVTKKPSRGSRDRYKRLKSLNCFPEVNGMLKEGRSPNDVARFIQEQRGEYDDIKHDTLMRILQKYREEIPPAQLIAPQRPKVVFDAQDRFDDGVRELERLDELYNLQMERVYEAREREKTFPFLIDNLRENIDQAVKIVHEMHDVKMDLGIGGGRNLGTLTMSPGTVDYVKSQYGDGVARVIQSSESRNKVLSLVRRMTIVANDDYEDEDEINKENAV